MENGDRIGARRHSAEQARGLPVFDRRDRTAHFSPRLEEAVGGRIKTAADRAAVVAQALDGYAQSSLRLGARLIRGVERNRDEEG
jgi:hypothetical protein